MVKWFSLTLDRRKDRAGLQDSESTVAWQGGIAHQWGHTAPGSNPGTTTLQLVGSHKLWSLCISVYFYKMGRMSPSWSCLAQGRYLRNVSSTSIPLLPPPNSISIGYVGARGSTPPFPLPSSFYHRSQTSKTCLPPLSSPPTFSPTKSCYLKLDLREGSGASLLSSAGWGLTGPS